MINEGPIEDPFCFDIDDLVDEIFDLAFAEWKTQTEKQRLNVLGSQLAMVSFVKELESPEIKVARLSFRSF